MSLQQPERNGDKVRSNRQRKAKMHQRRRIREFRKTTEQHASKGIGRRNSGCTEERIAVWEDEGGSVKETPERGMIGTVNQIAAKQIKTEVNAEFDRVANAL